MKLVPLAFLLSIVGPGLATASVAEKEPTTITLKDQVAPVAGAYTVQLEVRTQAESDRIAAEAAKDQSRSLPALAGVPLIQTGAAPAAAGSVASDSAPPPNVPATAQAVGPGVPVAGEPVKVYTTLAAAAQDGVDPMGDLNLKLKPVEKPVEKAFDWHNPDAYLAYLRTNPGYAIQGGVGILVAALALWLMRRRRG